MKDTICPFSLYVRQLRSEEVTLLTITPNGSDKYYLTETKSALDGRAVTSPIILAIFSQGASVSPATVHVNPLYAEKAYTVERNMHVFSPYRTTGCPIKTDPYAVLPKFL